MGNASRVAPLSTNSPPRIGGWRDRLIEAGAPGAKREPARIMAVKWKGAFVESVRAIRDRRITKGRSSRRVARLADGRINSHRTVGDWTGSADWLDPGLRRHGGRSRFQSYHHACRAERSRPERHPAYGHQRRLGLAVRCNSLFRRRV